ncbi:MAG: flagellar export protein FliJ [Epulopiscium sp. Nele67-Bin001]|nr:MAG: flagellar export protein FliJ [Epulopiscium sp. Nuni2H_MBin001]OON92027.1 MAG: flagellar export protein FliJ [Epulopiscium sp. Nele67-Bin001]
MKFRLESILTLKKNVEQMRKKELADAYAQKNFLVNKEVNLQRKDNELSQQLVQELSGAVNPSAITQVNHYKKQIVKDLEKVHLAVAQAEKNIVKKQENLVDAMKDRKILENLKEIHREQVQYEMLQEEQKLIDEIVGYRYIKSSEEEGNS